MMAAVTGSRNSRCGTSRSSPRAAENIRMKLREHHCRPKLGGIGSLPYPSTVELDCRVAKLVCLWRQQRALDYVIRI